MKIWVRNCLCFAILSTLVGCVSSDGDEESEEAVGWTEDAIIDGVATKGYSNVGILHMAGDTVCTGFLISPRVVATAAHCIAYGAPLAYYTGRGKPVSTPSKVPSISNLTKHDVQSFKRHYNYKFGQKGARYDVGYVVLAKPQPFGPLPYGGTISSKKATTCTTVGYGVNSWTHGEGTGGVRRRGEATAKAKGSDEGYSDIEVWAGESLANNGDSGGPIICNGSAVGIFSWMKWDFSGKVYRNQYVGTDGTVKKWLDAAVADNP